MVKKFTYLNLLVGPNVRLEGFACGLVDMKVEAAAREICKAAKFKGRPKDMMSEDKVQADLISV